MSLISEALRKARQHGAHDERAGSVVPPTLVLPPRRYRSGVSPVALLVVALAAGVGGAAGVWWALARPRETTGPRHAAPPEAAAVLAPTAAAVVPAAVPSPTPRPSLQAPAPPAEPPAAATAPAASPTAGPAPISPHLSAPPAEGAASHERVFLVDADLGYAKLHLDYLIYRPSSPFARINGQDVVTGSTVAGFLVEEISRDYVKLSDHKHTVVLRVR